VNLINAFFLTLPLSLPPSFRLLLPLWLQIQHFEHAFLKESWATYIECCWLEDTEGQDAFLFQVEGMGKRERGKEGGKD